VSGNAQLLLATGGADPGASLPSSISVMDSRLSPTNSTATFTLSNAGTYSSVGNGSAPSGTWRNFGASADYQARFTTGGAPTGSAINTWLSLSAGLSWSVTDSVVNGASVTASGTLQIRRASTGVVCDSCALSLSATKDI
jgi:hypothetical protein